MDGKTPDFKATPKGDPVPRATGKSSGQEARQSGGNPIISPASPDVQFISNELRLLPEGVVRVLPTFESASFLRAWAAKTSKGWLTTGGTVERSRTMEAVGGKQVTRNEKEAECVQSSRVLSRKRGGLLG